MTHLLFQLPKQVLFEDGVIQPGWEVEFFLTGTTTPTPVYTTSALTTTHTQPVKADASGVLPAVYLDPAIIYKASVYDSAGVLAYTIDPVNDVILSQSSIGALLYPRSQAEIDAAVTPTNYFKEYGNILRYGTNTTPGTTDMTTAIQAAVDSGHTVKFDKSGGPYYFREVDVADNGVVIDLCGSTCKLRATKVGTYHAFFVVTGDDVTISGGVFDGNIGAQSPDLGSIDSYAAIYAVGADRLRVSENYIYDTYANAAIRIIDGSDVSVTNNVIDCTDLSASYEACAAFYSVSGTRSNERVDFSGNQCLGGHIAVNDDLAAQWLDNWTISNNRIEKTETASDHSCIGARATGGIISNNYCKGAYFGLTASVGAGRVQSKLVVSGNVFENTDPAFHAYGIEHYGIDITIAGNLFIECGITSSSTTDASIAITGNTFRVTTATVYTEPAISFGLGAYRDVTISGNVCVGTGSFVKFTNCTQLNNCAVIGNVARLVLDPGASEFFAYRTNSTMTINRITIVGNTVENAARGYAYFDTSSGTLTVNRLRTALNSLDGNTGGLAYTNAAFTNCINEPNNQVTPQQTLTYSASMTPDAILGHDFIITATNGTAFTINAPTNGYDGQVITLTIRNGSGGALGAITWNATYKMAAWTSPANANSRSITFRYNGTNWVEITRTTADVPN